MIYPKTFSDKKYPRFIQKSVFLKAFPKPKKIFPRIGLKNSESLLSIKNKRLIKYRGNKKLKICFSSDGNKGYWDIATMSMRGIKSCMRWDNDHSISLIGSILDPYAAVIYITDDTNTKYGKKTIARSVVRLIVDINNKPGLFVERPYYSGDYNEYALSEIFASFLEKRTKLKVVNKNDDNEDIYSGYDWLYFIPTSEPVDSIIELEDFYPYDDSMLSYADSEIDYKLIKKFYDPMKVRI